MIPPKINPKSRHKAAAYGKTVGDLVEDWAHHDASLPDDFAYVKLPRTKLRERAEYFRAITDSLDSGENPDDSEPEPGDEIEEIDFTRAAETPANYRSRKKKNAS